MIWKIGMDNLGLQMVSIIIIGLKVQQSMSRLFNKTQRNSNGDNSLEGLDIDWHLAEYDYSVGTPISNDQPTYAYAA